MSDKILIVDDEPDTLKLLQAVLQREGYVVISATNGPEALAKIKAEPPDLVILDIMMPGMSGIEVLQQIRGDPKLAVLPVLMLTARSEVNVKVMAFEAGADEYVTKPLSAAELRARVRALLERTRRLAQQAVPSKRAKVVGMIGAKGGVGTTTVVLNVAAALAGRGVNTIAAEFRPYLGTFAAQLKQEAARNLSSILQRDPSQITAAEWSSLLYTFPAGLRVLFGPQQPREFYEVSPQAAQALVQGLGTAADMVILDLPSCPCPATQAIVPEMRLIGLVLEPDAVCVQMGKAVLELLESWGASRSILGAIVVNRAPLPSTLSTLEIGSQLRCEIIGAVPHAGPACQAAQERGRPLVQHQPESLAAMSLSEIATKIAQRLA